MKENQLIVEDYKGNKVVAHIVKQFKTFPLENKKITIELIPGSQEMVKVAKVKKKQFVQLKISKYDELQESVKKAENYNKNDTVFVKTNGIFNLGGPTETVYTDEKAVSEILNSLMQEKRLKESAESKLARLKKVRKIFGFTILRGSL